MPNDVAYGFIGVEHLFGERVRTIGIEKVRSLIDTTTRAWNREVNAMMSGWVQRGTTIQERVELPGTGTLQPLDETGWGNPIPTRETGHYQVGYPIQGGGDAWGTNRVSQELMTLEEMNRQTLAVMRKDAHWLRQHMLAAVLDNTSWTYNDKELGDVTVQPLANGDSTVYTLNNTNNPTTANHYIAQTAAIADNSNPYPTIYDTLLQYPSNSGPFVVYIPAALRATTEALADFVKINDPDIDPAITSNRLTGRLADASPGGRVIGKTDNVWVVEWRALPANTMVGVALGAGKFLRMREWPVDALKGLFAEYHSPDGNLSLNRFIRYAGFGVYNRVAAVVYQVNNGDTTYDIPTGYATPQP